MQTAPLAQHQWLKQLLGDWTYEGECVMGPDQPPMTMTGRESVRDLGGFWTVGEGENADHSMKSIMTLGFDPLAGRFVGTFVANMMSHLWVYNGTLDADQKVLTLETVGPNMADGSMTQYRDFIEFAGADERTLTSHMLVGGAFHPIMKATYKRAA